MQYVYKYLASTWHIVEAPETLVEVELGHILSAGEAMSV